MFIIRLVMLLKFFFCIFLYSNHFLHVIILLTTFFSEASSIDRAGQRRTWNGSSNSWT